MPGVFLSPYAFRQSADETALKTGKQVLITHGISDETSKAEEIIQRTGPESLIGPKI